MGKSSLCPGFRFYPTDEELVMFYLKKKLLGKKSVTGVIAEVNLYDFSPWDLPDKSNLNNGDLEWFFFCSKSRKYSNGDRKNRATEKGYWKATGKDREVKYKEKVVAMVKTLVFHLGRPPKGERTNWVMHEYRMEDNDLANAGVVQDAYVLCKLFEKRGAGPQNGAHYGKPFKEEDWTDDEDDETNGSESMVVNLSLVTKTVDHIGSCSDMTQMTKMPSTEPGPSTVTCSTLVDPSGNTNILDPSSSGSALTSTEPGQSSIVPASDDYIMLTHGEVDLIFNSNNTQEVEEDRKGKKVMTYSPNNDDDGFFKDDIVDAFFADDLDIELWKFLQD